jgi:hypothetical protein
VGPRAVLDTVVKRKLPNPAGNRTLGHNEFVTTHVRNRHLQGCVSNINKKAQFKVALKRYLNTHFF